MGQRHQPTPALLLVGLLWSDESVLLEAKDRLCGGLGRIHQLDLKAEFDWSAYYDEEMGAGLQRGFLWAEKLVERDALGPVKNWTQAIERDLSTADGRRRVNLDPGLLCLESLQLASTKNNGCRIYLGQGVFAELTLRYEHGAFQCLPWTYPDYGSDMVQEALLPLRDELKKRLRREQESVGRTQAQALLQEVDQ